MVRFTTYLKDSTSNTCSLTYWEISFLLTQRDECQVLIQLVPLPADILQPCYKCHSQGTNLLKLMEPGSDFLNGWPILQPAPQISKVLNVHISYLENQKDLFTLWFDLAHQLNLGQCCLCHIPCSQPFCPTHNVEASLLGPFSV